MIFFDWLPISFAPYVINFRPDFNLVTIICIAVLNFLADKIEDFIPRWMWNGIFDIYGYYLSCKYRLYEIQEIIRRILVRLTLVIQSLWSIDSFEDLLRLQHDYLEAKQQRTSHREYDRWEEFENSMNHLLARASRVCAREINHMPDLYAHFSDVFAFARSIWTFLKCAVLYVQAKRHNRMTERWIRVVQGLQARARNSGVQSG